MNKKILSVVTEVTEAFFKRKISQDELIEFDSMTIIEYLFQLETKLNITIDITQVDREKMNQITKIAAFIEENYGIGGEQSL